MRQSHWRRHSTRWTHVRLRLVQVWRVRACLTVFFVCFLCVLCFVLCWLVCCALCLCARGDRVHATLSGAFAALQDLRPRLWCGPGDVGVLARVQAGRWCKVHERPVRRDGRRPRVGARRALRRMRAVSGAITTQTGMCVSRRRVRVARAVLCMWCDVLCVCLCLVSVSVFYVCVLDHVYFFACLHACMLCEIVHVRV